MINSNKQIKILLIEDHKVQVDFVEKIFNSPGYLFTSISDGLEAVEYLTNTKNNPDVVLVDYHLPGIDGIEIIEQVQARGRLFGYIFFTADNTIDTAVKAMKAGALDFIHKSAKLKTELPAMVDKVYNLHKARIATIEEQTRIHQSEIHYRNLFHNSPLAYWEEDASRLKAYIETLKSEGVTNFNAYFNQNPAELSKCVDLIKVKTINSAAAKLYNIDIGHLENLQLSSLFKKKNLETFKKELLSFIKGKYVFTYESFNIHDDGEDKMIFNSVSVVLTDIEGWSNLIVAVVDISEQKKAQKELMKAKERAEENEIRLKAIIHTMPDLLFHIDNTGKFLSFYQENKYKELFTKTPDFVGQTIYDIFDQNFAKLAQKKISETLKKGSTECEYQLDDKEPKFFHAKFSKLNHNQIIIISRDITEQKRTENAIKVSEDKYRRLFEDDLTGDYILDSDGKIIECNNSFVEIMGYDSKKELIGKNIKLLYSDFSEFNRIKQELTKQKILRNFETIRKKKNGDLINIIENKVADFNREGILTGIKGYIYDITERKKAEQVIKESEKKLQESNLTKDKFFSIIAHDLKNPFGSMLGFTELLIKKFDKYDKEKQLKLLNFVYNDLKATYNLLENLLTWSYSHRQKLDFKLERINIFLLVDKIIEVLLQMAENKSIKIINNIPEEVSVTADINMLSTIIRNLITNAIKYSYNGGQVLINLDNSENTGFIKIYVKDNGVGIPEEYQSALFDISSKNSTKGTENEGGTGLGLILCQEFVEKLGGNIWVESKPGRGSKFIFTIPEFI